MLEFWQSPILALLLTLHLPAQEPPAPAFSWVPIEVKHSLFSQDLVMLDSERDQYATNLAAYATNEVASSRASLASLSRARRILALAMHLSPRNKQTLVTQFQLAKGIVPEKVAGDYTPSVLARLLLTRGRLLLQESSGENIYLAHLLIQLAAEINPRNQDAVYESELNRIDHGPPDWQKLTPTPTGTTSLPTTPPPNP